MLINGKQIRDHSIPRSKLAFGAEADPTSANKDMVASVTAADFDLACTTTIAFTPDNGSYVSVAVNGATQNVGNGDRTHDCYFSLDGGNTALAFTAITAGALLYWVGSIAGFQLDATDRIDFFFNA